MKKLVLVLVLVCTIIALCVGCSKEENNVIEETSEENVEEKEERKFDANLQEYKFDKIGEEVEVAEVDLDMDGKKDTVSVKATENKKIDTLGTIDIKVNDATYKQEFGDYETAIYTLSIDENTVLFALVNKGIDAIAETYFFQYRDSKIESVGSISNDVRHVNDKESKKQVVIEKGVIKWLENIGIMGVNPIIVSKWDGKNIERKYEGEFEVSCSQESFKVKKDINILKDYNDDKSNAVIKANQNMKITKVNLKLDKGEFDAAVIYYLYVEAEDGTKGWFNTIDLTEEDIDGIHFAG